MRLKRSRIEGYGPCPQARARLARAAVVHRPALRRAREQNRRPLRTPACVARGTFSKSAILHRFPNFYTLRVEIYRMFFIRSRLRMNPMKHEKFHGNRSTCF